MSRPHLRRFSIRFAYLLLAIASGAGLLGKLSMLKAVLHLPEAVKHRSSASPDIALTCWRSGSAQWPA